MRLHGLLLTTATIVIAGSIASPALAQDAATAEDATPVANAPGGSARTFDPAYFAQFAPRNALDMVTRIPGFIITGGNDQGQRGLGQATQNVVVNGERLSSKSDSVADQLRRIPASDVVRIELVDGNTLDIPGLTGVVANVVYESNAASGQFRWTTGFRPHNTAAELFGGEISVTGKTGKLNYTVALSNPNNRFGADGPITITDGAGELIETQYSVFSGKSDEPKLATTLAYDFGGGVQANLNLNYAEDFYYRREPEIGIPVVGPIRTRQVRTHEDGPQYEIGGDIQFPLGPGTLKLIGLENYERDNFTQTLIDRFDDGSAATGVRFDQTNGYGERIGRAEYSWKLWQADWQLSGEAAFNRLDRSSALFDLAPDGEFVSLPFPGGTGGVREDR
ncbi:MAG: Plug domain-containing protein, partial [Erythrobacter sp.]|nr:Plug domain-containing protein [Erythrobacter sp.]